MPRIGTPFPFSMNLIAFKRNFKVANGSFMQELVKLKELESYISDALSAKLQPGQYRLFFSYYRRKLFISSVMTIENGQKVELNRLPIPLATLTTDGTFQTELSEQLLTSILSVYFHENGIEYSILAIEKYLAIAMNDFFERYATYPPRLN